MSNSNPIVHDFKEQMILLEKDAVIDSLLEELEIKELKHKILLMQRFKKLKELGCESIGVAFYNQFGVSFMDVEYVNLTIKETKNDESKSLKSKSKILRIIS